MFEFMPKSTYNCSQKKKEINTDETVLNRVRDGCKNEIKKESIEECNQMVKDAEKRLKIEKDECDSNCNSTC